MFNFDRNLKLAYFQTFNNTYTFNRKLTAFYCSIFMLYVMLIFCNIFPVYPFSMTKYFLIFIFFWTCTLYITEHTGEQISLFSLYQKRIFFLNDILFNILYQKFYYILLFIFLSCDFIKFFCFNETCLLQVSSSVVF